jgi:hypothetical protein
MITTIVKRSTQHAGRRDQSHTEDVLDAIGRCNAEAFDLTSRLRIIFSDHHVTELDIRPCKTVKVVTEEEL